ncbi:MAG TPA: GNAT family N-acetyltransferase [Candidatus Binatia bacterium]
MRLRKATIEDAEALASLLTEIGWFEVFKNESLEESTQRVRAELELCLADDSHLVCVAQSEEGKIIGYVSVHWLPYLFMRGPEAYVSELVVRDSARGRGVGRRLLQAVETEARSRGCTRMSLTNLRRRESYKRQFYVKAGWTERSDAANFIYQIA